MTENSGHADERTANVEVFKFYEISKSQTKGLPNGKPLFNLAEAQRFELWNPFGSPVFKTGAFNRSATLPE